MTIDKPIITQEEKTILKSFVDSLTQENKDKLSEILEDYPTTKPRDFD